MPCGSGSTRQNALHRKLWQRNNSPLSDFRKRFSREILKIIDFKTLFSSSDPTAKPHAHGNYIDATNRFLYACDLGSDTLGVFHFDPEKRTLEPQSPHAKFEKGTGPRHLAFHPSQKYIYVNQEMGLGVSVFERNHSDGSLTLIDTERILPPVGFMSKEKVSTAEILCHPSGKWIYLSIRGYESIATLSIGDDGKLTQTEQIPSPVKFPRGMTIDPSGQWLIVGGQKDNRITSLKIDSTTGKLQTTDQYITVESPVCMVFTPNN